MTPLPVKALLHLLAPALCASCDLPLVGPSGPFCEGCALLVELHRAQRANPAQAGVVYVYGGPMAAAIKALKYGGRSELAPGLAGLMVRAGLRRAALGVPAAAVVPVPLHPARLRARGYNQSALLARPVARALGLPLRTGWLRRRRDTPPQAGLESDQRLDNVREAFAVRAGLSPTRVLLIDDVRTSGATLAACAETLLRAGHPPPKTLALAGVER